MFSIKLIRGLFLCFAVALVFNIRTSFAAEMRAPDEVELKAAYCISVLQHLRGLETAIQQSDVSEEIAKDISSKAGKTADNLNRLQSFLIPRTDYIDMDALSLAHSRGQKDIQSMDASGKNEECQARCFPPKVEGTENVKKCWADCLDEDEVYKRVHVCNTIDFLPY